MKIVINHCFGGCGLSHKAMMLWSKASNTPLFTFYNEEQDWTKTSRWIASTDPEKELRYFTSPTPSDETYFRDVDIERTDPHLVAVVEQLGDEANGFNAKVEVCDIPAGTRYRIIEYDGFEGLEYLEDVVWQTAT